MCTVEWCGVAFVAADELFRGCEGHGKMPGMPGERFGLHSGQALHLMQIHANTTTPTPCRFYHTFLLWPDCSALKKCELKKT